jgi:hypothetical protein
MGARSPRRCPSISDRLGNVPLEIDPEGSQLKYVLLKYVLEEIRELLAYCASLCRDCVNLVTYGRPTLLYLISTATTSAGPPDREEHAQLRS